MIHYIIEIVLLAYVVYLHRQVRQLNNRAGNLGTSWSNLKDDVYKALDRNEQHIEQLVRGSQGENDNFATDPGKPRATFTPEHLKGTYKLDTQDDGAS